MNCFYNKKRRASAAEKGKRRSRKRITNMESLCKVLQDHAPRRAASQVSTCPIACPSLSLALLLNPAVINSSDVLPTNHHRSQSSTFMLHPKPYPSPTQPIPQPASKSQLSSAARAAERKSSSQLLTRSEIDRRIREDKETLIVFHGGVYNLTKWIKYHPGGELAVQHMNGMY